MRSLRPGLHRRLNRRQLDVGTTYARLKPALYAQEWTLFAVDR